MSDFSANGLTFNPGSVILFICRLSSAAIAILLISICYTYSTYQLLQIQGLVLFSVWSINSFAVLPCLNVYSVVLCSMGCDMKPSDMRIKISDTTYRDYSVFLKIDM